MIDLRQGLQPLALRTHQISLPSLASRLVVGLCSGSTGYAESSDETGPGEADGAGSEARACTRRALTAVMRGGRIR